MAAPFHHDRPARKTRPSLHDLAADKEAALRAAFPEVFTEGGKIDFERLKLALGEMVDAGKERYGMNWPGKADCFKTIQQPSMATLVPCPAESWPPLPFTNRKEHREHIEGAELPLAESHESLRSLRSLAVNTSENLIIEGDNLEVLKLLQKSYLGRVKMISIDPPYNTGNDFIYPDNYAESLETYLRYTGQVDREGRKYSTNTEADGRFHSKWLNMMYPRLYLARNLLREDGLIFINIDDNEVDNLRKLCEEVFGEENIVSVVVWQKSYGGGAKVKHVVGLHEYVLVVAKNLEAIGFLDLPPDPGVLKYYKFKDAKFETRGPFRTQPLATTSMDNRPNLRFPIRWKGNEIWPEKQWQWSEERVKQALANDELVIAKKRERWVVDYKQYLKDEDGKERGAKPFAILKGPYTQVGTEDVRSLGLDTAGFSFPKPVGLIEEFLHYGDKDAVVLDFFAGSGTTGQAVLELNQRDGGNRQFILVQLPEPTERKNFPTIADITKERVRRVIKKLNDEDAADLTAKERKEHKEGKELPLVDTDESLRSLRSLRLNPDRGFKVFKLQSSNFKTWNADAPKDEGALAKQLEMHVHHIVDGRSQDDLLFELLLKSGFPLTTPIETLTLAGQTVFSIAEGAMLICLEKALTPEVIKEMAARKPERVVCLDEGFAGNDQLKTNAVQTMKTKGVTSFRTV